MSFPKRFPNYRATPYIPAKDPLSAIPPSRHPFQFWTMFAVVVGGSGNLLEGQSPINDLLTPIAVIGFNLMMVAGGVLAILGSFARDRVNGLLLERLGLSALALAASLYGVAILYLLGSVAVIQGPITIAIGIASVWRVVHVNRELKALKQFIEAYY